MRICRIYIFSFVIMVAIGSNVIVQATGSEKTVGKIEDLTKPSMEDIKTIKDTLQETQEQINDMANKNFSASIYKFNKAIQSATRDIKEAVNGFEENYSAESRAILLERMSRIYSNLLSGFNKIPIDFLERAQDVYGNAASKGQRLSRENLKRTEEDFRFKERLLNSKVSKLRELDKDIRENQANRINEAKRLIKDITRLERMISRGKRSAKWWEKIAKDFEFIEQQKRSQLDGLETSIMEFNQLRADIEGQKEIIDQAIIIGQLDELATEEFESSISDVMRAGDSLWSAADAALDDVFGNLLDDDELGNDSSDDKTDRTDDGSIGDQIQAILSKYN